jgi:hypothetical protein
MKNVNGSIANAADQTQFWSDAFCDYLNDTYFEGALDCLDDDTINFEYDNFFNDYAK